MSDRLRQMATQAAETAVSLTRPSYFDSKERGELPELRQELLSDTYIIRREAVRKVIAGMTAGGKDDYGELFPEILRCLQSKDVETKRLVYLYLTTYAEERPEMALLAVNTFVKDSEDKTSAIVRSLALRTMGGLRIPNLIDYIDDPLRRAIRDDNFMVRRTAAICIGKLFVNHREYFDDMELTSALQLLLGDQDPFVASNAVGVLLQHYEAGLGALIDIDPTLIARLSQTMEKAGEWGQLNILTLWLKYAPQCSMEQAGVLLRRSAAYLAHGNAAVAVAACRLIINLLQRFPDSTAQYDRRVSTSLTSVLCGLETSKELCFVVLKMLVGLVQVMPSASPPLPAILISHEDVLYVKRAKLELMAAMADRHNLLSILSELTEYAKDVDMQFAESVVYCLCRLCIRFAGIDAQLRRIIVQLLVDFCKTGVGHLLKSAIVSLHRVYTCDDASILPTVLSCFLHDPYVLDGPESRAALVNLTSHCQDADTTLAVLAHFDLAGETLPVQLALLHAHYSLTSRGIPPDQGAAWLESASTSGESALLNHRARLYKRLLEGKTRVDVDYDECVEVPAGVPVWFLSDLGLLSSVYHRPVSAAGGGGAGGGASGASGDGDATTSSANGHDAVADYLTDFRL